jgi:hypothetical protein
VRHRERGGPGQPDLPIKAVIVSAARAGRIDAWRMLAIAIGISCLTAVAELAADRLVDKANVPVAVVSSLGTTALSMLGVVFLSGFLSQLVGEAGHGRQPVTFTELLRNLPWWRLILADLLVVTIVVAGVLALIIPGLIAINLLAVVGPVIEIEDRRVIAALRRSAQLVRLHFWKVALLATLPVVAEDELSSLAPESHGAHGLLLTIVIKGVAEALIELALGLVLAELCWRLIAIDQVRRGSAVEGLAPAGR